MATLRERALEAREEQLAADKERQRETFGRELLSIQRLFREELELDVTKCPVTFVEDFGPIVEIEGLWFTLGSGYDRDRLVLARECDKCGKLITSPAVNSLEYLGQCITNDWTTWHDCPAETPEPAPAEKRLNDLVDAIGQELERRGWLTRPE